MPKDYQRCSDPEQNPAFSRLWEEPPVPPFRSAGEAAAAVLDSVAFRQRVRAIYQLGERPVAELLAEIAATFCDDPTDLDAPLNRYASLDPEKLEATGGTDLPPLPSLRRAK